jgi:hypothetical protein
MVDGKKKRKREGGLEKEGWIGGSVGGESGSFLARAANPPKPLRERQLITEYFLFSNTHVHHLQHGLKEEKSRVENTSCQYRKKSFYEFQCLKLSPWSMDVSLGGL